MSAVRVAALLAACACANPAPAAVVINEIFYHAPDDLDDLQFVELHNTGDQAVSLAGWKLTKVIRYEFPAGTTIGPGGYLVVCKSLREFRRHYGFDAAGQYEGSLSHSGEEIELRDAAGKKVDNVKYKTRSPWPVAPDGYGSSLERICPTAPGNVPENWAASPLAPGSPKPGGTPVDAVALLQCTSVALTKVKEFSDLLDKKLAEDLKRRDKGGFMAELRAENDR